MSSTAVAPAAPLPTTPLPVRRLGQLAVSSIGLGCMGLNHAYGAPPSREDGARLLNQALDLGVTLLDTAALYGAGENERLIGEAVMHRRAEFVLATKCVLDVVDGARVLDGSPAAIRRTVDGSLGRLGTDHIDLVYLHRLDPAVAIEESVGALVELVEAGKVGAIGLSEMSAATVRRAHAVHPIAAVQTEYSPIVRNAEVGVMAACRELGIGFVAFSPVVRGMLAGALRSPDPGYGSGDIRQHMPRFNGELLAHNLAVVAAFEALASGHRMTPAQLSLAWVLARGDHIVPIPGTADPAHLVEDVAAAAIMLSDDVVAAIDAIFVPGAIRGPRYPAPMQRQIDTEIMAGEELA